METETQSLDTFVSGLSDRQLHCRELGHTWRPLTVAWDESARCYDRRLRCTQCRTVRVQILDTGGGVVSNHYIYPDGYLAKGVAESLSGRRDTFRIEAINRYFREADKSVKAA